MRRLRKRATGQSKRWRLLVVRVFDLAKDDSRKMELGRRLGKMHSMQVEMLEYHASNQISNFSKRLDL